MDPPKTQKKKQTGSQRVLLRGEYLNFDLLDGDDGTDDGDMPHPPAGHSRPAAHSPTF